VKDKARRWKTAGVVAARRLGEGHDKMRASISLGWKMQEASTSIAWPSAVRGITAGGRGTWVPGHWHQSGGRPHLQGSKACSEDSHSVFTVYEVETNA